MTSWLVPAAAIAALLAALAVAFGLTSAKPIAFWQMVGGATILLVWGISLTQPSIAAVSLVMVVSSLGMAGLALVAGMLLWRNRLIGIRLSIVAQALQVAWISLPLVQLGSTLGPTIGLRLTATAVTFNMGFYGRAGFALLPPDTGYRYPLDITVNVLALIALSALVRMQRSRAPKAAA